MDHDRPFKELLTTFFYEFVALFLPEIQAYLEPSSVVFLDKEIFTDINEGARYEADLIARARFRGEEAFFPDSFGTPSAAASRFRAAHVSLFRTFAPTTRRAGLSGGHF